MKKLSVCLLVLFALLGCGKEEITQNPNVLEGTYRTNGFLDPLCIAITDDTQLPTLTISKKNNGTYELLRTNYIPQKSTQKLEEVTAKTITGGFELYHGQTKIGTYRDDRWYDDKKDKEVTSKVLAVSYANAGQGLYFSYFGVKK